MSRCRSCGAPVHWQVLSSGRKMPCDPEIVVVATEAGHTVRGRVSHTCPDAKEHRRNVRDFPGKMVKRLDEGDS